MRAGRAAVSGAAAAALLATAPLAAEEEVTVTGAAEIGVAGVRLSDDDARYGRYTGTGNETVHLIGDLSLSATRGHRRIDLSVADGGLDARRLRVEAAADGTYSIALHHEQVPNLLHRSAQSPYSGIGGDTLTLPDGVTPGTTTTDIDGLAGSLRPLTLRTERRRNGIETALALDAHWQTHLSFEHERKQGLQHFGGVTGQSARFAATTLLPRPVDFETGTLETGIVWQRGRRQFEAGYHLSTFRNARRAVTWEVPFVQGSEQALDHPGRARGGLEPDNRHQRVRLGGAIGLPWSGRLSTVIEVGRMEQDDTLLPLSTDDIDGTSQLTEDGAPLPRATAQARIDTRHAALNLSARPLPRLGLRFGYRYFELDNRTPYTRFDRVVNDTLPQTLSEDLYSRPIGYRQSSLDANGRYRLAGGLGIRTRLRHQRTYREEHAPVRRTIEDTLGITLNRRLGARASWRVGYTRAEREGDGYNAFRSYSTLYDAAGCPDDESIVNPCFSNHPDLRMLHIADRSRDRVNADLHFSPVDAVDLGIHIAGIRDRYRDPPAFGDTQLGLLSDDLRSLTLDASHASDRWGIHAHYTHERIQAVQQGRAFTGAAGTVNDPARDWRADFDNVVDTVSINARFHSFDRRHELLLGYTLALETGDIAFTTGDALEAEDMPRNRIRRQVFEIRGSRELREHWHLNLGVEYEIFDSRDRAVDRLEAGGTQLDDVLPIAGALPDYRAVMAWAAVRVRW